MKRNVASQLIVAQMISATDGSDVTAGTCNVAVEKDGAAGTGGTATHIANGKWEYAPIQSDTDGAFLTFQFVITGAITATIQTYTYFPQTVDNNVLAAGATGFAAIDTVVDATQALAVGATGFAAIDTVVDSILADTGELQVDDVPGLIATVQADLDTITGSDGVTLATAQGLYAPNKVVPDAAGVAPTIAEITADVWDEATVTARTAGTYGQLFKDNVDGTISSRMAEASINTTAGAVDTVTTTATTTTNTDMVGTDNAALATSLTTAQNDLDIITGASGVNLLTATQATLDVIDGADGLVAISAQIDGIGAASGAALNYEATSDNLTVAIKTVDNVGTPTGTFGNTQAEDGSVVSITDTANDIDHIFGYTIGGGRTATEMTFAGYLQGANDAMLIQAFDFVGGDWETIQSLAGKSGTANVTIVASLLSKHTGTGADLGNVYIRFEADGVMSTPVLVIDKLLVAAVNIGQSVGYANGEIWVDASGVDGSEVYVNGTADNPCKTLANAISLATSTGLSRFDVGPGTTITFGETHNDQLWNGHGWTLALGGQDVDECHFFNAAVSGVGTAAGEIEFHDCEISTASVQNAHHYNCTFDGTVTMTLAGDYHYINCQSGVAGANAPTFTKTAGQAITAEWRRWSGGINITGLQAGDTLTISGELGTIDLGSSAGGIVEIRGTYKAIANAGSVTVGITGAVLAADVAAILADTNELQTDDVPTLIGTAQSDLDIITGVSGVNLLTATQASIDAIEADTNELQVDDIPTLIGTAQADLDTITGATGVNLLTATQNSIDAIEADTNELQVDDVPALIATAQADLDTMSNGIIEGTAATGTLSTTVATSSLTGYADDQLIGRIITFYSGAADGESSDITDYASLNGTITFTAMTTASGNGDTFKIT